jgi:GMP reductase
MLLDTQIELDFEDVLMLPQLARKNATSRNNVILERTFINRPESYRYYNWTGIPIIAANMDTVGTFEMAKVLITYNCCTALHKHYSVDDLVKFYKENEQNEHLLFFTMGLTDNSLEKLCTFKEKYKIPKNICIDVANGYMPHFTPFISTVRELAPESFIMAGNVVTGDATYALLNAGASCAKIGIGNGAACSTRHVTGVGRPQLSAIIECANAAHGLNGLICSDGGCVIPGDISKAIGAGADFVMLGSMLAGHDESGGKIIYEFVVNLPNNSKLAKHDKIPKYVEFYGMSSDIAMEKYSGGMADYKASEGRVLRIPYRGPVEKTIQEILGGIRSSMMYIGAMELKEISKCTRFIRVNKQLNTSLIQYEEKIKGDYNE